MAAANRTRAASLRSRRQSGRFDVKQREERNDPRSDRHGKRPRVIEEGRLVSSRHGMHEALDVVHVEPRAHRVVAAVARDGGRQCADGGDQHDHAETRVAADGGPTRER